MKKVELFTAYLWTCDECGRDNFVRSVVLEPGLIDIDDFPEEVREWIEDVGTGNFCTMPARVTCAYCKTKFETEDPRDCRESDERDG